MPKDVIQSPATPVPNEAAYSELQAKQKAIDDELNRLSKQLKDYTTSVQEIEARNEKKAQQRQRLLDLAKEFASIEAEIDGRVEAAKEPSLAIAEKKIKKYAAAAAGGAAAGGMVPFVPFIDLAAIAGIQLKMLSDLAKQFEVPFKEDWGKSALATVVGSVGTGTMFTAMTASVIKIIPIFGQMANLVALPTVAYVSTYAVGKVFLAHFASGGQLLDLDPAKAAQAYKGFAEEAKEEEAKSKAEPAAPAAAAA